MSNEVRQAHGQRQGFVGLGLTVIVVSIVGQLPCCFASRHHLPFHQASSSSHDVNKLADDFKLRTNVSNSTHWGVDVDHCTLGGGQWPLLGQLDIVITWWTNGRTGQHVYHPSMVNKGKNTTLLNGTSSSDYMRIENQGEIKYMLRSFEKYGLLDYVRDVIILVDHEVIDQFGPPGFFNYKNKRLRVVTDTDIGMDNVGYKWAKWLTMQTIPGLSDYFLYMADDVFLMKPFEISSLFNSATGKPILNGFGSWSEGWCDQGVSFGSSHGPHLFNKCAYQAVADHYHSSGFYGGHMAGHQKLDAICLVSNAMVGQWSGGWMGIDTPFFYECHTNGNCHISSLEYKDAMFMNIQGPGVSDDYAANLSQKLAADSLLKGRFSAPSRFES